MLNVDEGLIIALNLLYTEVYNQLEGGRDGNFVTTLPLVPVESRIDTIINKCLELLPWYKKVRYAGLPQTSCLSASYLENLKAVCPVRLRLQKE